MQCCDVMLVLLCIHLNNPSLCSVLAFKSKKTVEKQIGVIIYQDRIIWTAVFMLAVKFS